VIAYPRVGHFCQKQSREFDRDALDERVILAGDLTLTDSVIDSMNKQGEKYLHITLAFKEDEISREALQGITDEFRDFAFSAYQDDEFNFYGEAHLPKIKSYNHKRTGEEVVRKPHIHIVVPEHNLLSGQNLNPLGKVEHQTKFLEAFQEHINAKYGLASPKDNQRLEITGESEMISRYKGDVFKGQGSEIKAELLDAVIKNNVTDWSDFRALSSEFGVVKERRGGAYLNIKPEGAAKGINLKESQFSLEFIELPTTEKLQKLSADRSEGYSSPGRPKPTSVEIKDRLREWHEVRAREVRHINSGNRKLYAEWKKAGLERRQAILAEREQKFNDKWRTKEHEQSGRERAGFADLEDDLRTAGRHLESASRVAGGAEQAARGVIDRRASRAVSAAVLRFIGDQAEPSQEQQQRLEDTAGQESDSVTSQHRHDLAEKKQEAKQQGEMVQIKRELDAIRLLAKVSHSHGVQPERYSISKGRDGGDRIKCGTRNLNVSDFLTKEVNLPWQEAQQILLDTYSEQQAQEPQQQHKVLPQAELWKAYRNDWLPAQRQSKNEAWKKQKTEDKTRREGLRQKWYTQKNQIEGNRGLPWAKRRAALSVARMEKALADKALFEQIRIERDELKRRYQQPVAEQFRIFLTEKVQQGDQAALFELRRQTDKPSKAKPGTPTVEGADQKQEQEQVDAPIMGGLHYQVDRRGDVHYNDAQGRRLFTDTGREVRTYLNTHQELETALRLAVQKFGTKLTINGTDEYKKVVQDVVASSDLRVRFADPAMEEARKESETAAQRVKQFDQSRIDAAHKSALAIEKQRQKEREEQQREKETEQRKDQSKGRDGNER